MSYLYLLSFLILKHSCAGNKLSTISSITHIAHAELSSSPAWNGSLEASSSLLRRRSNIFFVCCFFFKDCGFYFYFKSSSFWKIKTNAKRTTLLNFTSWKMTFTISMYNQNFNFLHWCISTCVCMCREGMYVNRILLFWFCNLLFPLSIKLYNYLSMSLNVSLCYHFYVLSTAP